MKIHESNLSTTASVPLDCEAECGKTSAPPGRAEKKQKTSHEVKATSQLPCNLGEEHINYRLFHEFFSIIVSPHTTSEVFPPSPCYLVEFLKHLTVMT